MASPHRRAPRTTGDRSRSLAIAALVAVATTATLARAQEPSEPPAAVAEPIKVMSFNIRYGTARDGANHWRQRSDLVAETIRMFDPDLLGTQEVLQFQAEFLQRALPEHGFHGVGRDDGEAAGEYAPVLYRKSRFELLDAGHFWLSETPAVAGSKSWDSSLPRMVSWVRLSDSSDDGAQLVFMNTHFDHRGRTARLESARLVRKRAEQFMAEGIPLVITGDFNATEDERPYAELVSSGDGGEFPIIDSFRRAHPERRSDEASFGRWTGHREGSRIDWLLHSPQFVTLQCAINHSNDGGRFPSDHYPVQAILRLR
jgi:endonuclease/exonuclease/phosphatase family metal-dependent hydrolase